MSENAQWLYIFKNKLSQHLRVKSWEGYISSKFWFRKGSENCNTGFIKMLRELSVKVLRQRRNSGNVSLAVVVHLEQGQGCWLDDLFLNLLLHQFSSVQLLSRVWLFATTWIAACQAYLSIINSQSSLRLRSLESVMPSSHLILCRFLLLLPPIPPSIRVFSNESTLHMRWPKFHFGVSALASFPPKKSHGWSPSEWTGWISLQSKGLSRVFSNTTDQKHQFFGAQLSSQFNSHIHTWPLEKP